MGIEVRGAHASNPAMRGAADSVEEARKIKVGPAPDWEPTRLSNQSKHYKGYVEIECFVRTTASLEY